MKNKLNPTTSEWKEPKVKFLTPVPFVHLKLVKKKGEGSQDPDLVVVSLKQLVKAQEDFDSLLSRSIRKAVKEAEEKMKFVKLRELKEYFDERLEKLHQEKIK